MERESITWLSQRQDSRRYSQCYKPSTNLRKTLIRKESSERTIRGASECVSCENGTYEQIYYEHKSRNYD